MKETIQAKITEVQSIKAAAAEDQVAVAPTKLERKRRQSRDLKAALEQAEEDGVCAAAAAPEQPANNSAPGPAQAEEEGVRGSSTHVDLNNLKDSGTGELSAEEFAALRAKTKSAAEVAKNMTPEQQAAYGCKTGVAASAVREDSDESDDEGADFQMGAEGQGALLADY